MFGLWQVTRNASTQSVASLLSPSAPVQHTAASASATAGRLLLLFFDGGDDGRRRNPMDYRSEKFQFRLVAVDDTVSPSVARNLRLAVPELSANQQRLHQEQQQQFLGRYQNLIKRKTTTKFDRVIWVSGVLC